MFGHQDSDQTNTDQTMQNGAVTNDSMPMHDAPAVAPAADANTATTAPSVNGVNDSAGDYIMTGLPGTQPADTPVHGADGSANLPAPTDVAVPAHTPTDELIDLKQKALQQLSPIVNHLDQTPEEKFRTTMMMIQASDDQSLIKVAYDAAQQITDEKLKAQALLDVINEINYFTQQQES